MNNAEYILYTLIIKADQNRLNLKLPCGMKSGTEKNDGAAALSDLSLGKRREEIYQRFRRLAVRTVIGMESSSQC